MAGRMARHDSETRLIFEATMDRACDLNSIARNAVNSLIEDAKRSFRGERREIFARAIQNAVRHTGELQIQHLRDLLRECGLISSPQPEGMRSLIN